VKEFFTVKEAADFANVSPRTILRLINSGRLEASDYGLGKHHNYRITHEALVAVRKPPAIPTRRPYRRHRGEFGFSTLPSGPNKSPLSIFPSVEILKGRPKRP